MVSLVLGVCFITSPCEANGMQTGPDWWFPDTAIGTVFFGQPRPESAAPIESPRVSKDMSLFAYFLLLQILN